ncbi:MAG: flagellar hook-length control protein FliK [Firmicutes bacterium]|nr:flagellar hook-length control protein FliK [Bacillota bacterium]
MDATTALLVQGCACPPAAHAAVTAAMTSVVSPNVGTPIACDAGPYAEFDTVLEQMAGQLQTSEPRHGAEPAVAVESSKRNEHGARAACTDPEADIRPAHDDDSNGDEGADGSDSTALRQAMVIAAGSSLTAPVRESVTVSTERPVDVKVRTAPHVEPKNAYTSARVGRDQPARNGSPRLTSMPTAEPGMAPRVQERTMVLPDMRGTADRDENAQVAPERLTMAATEGPMAIESEQPAEARSTDGQGSVSQQPGYRELTSADARASQPESAYMAVDQAHGSTVGQGGRVTGGTLADEAPVRESVTASAERPVDGRVRTAARVEPKNTHTSARVGRDEPARNGSPGSVDVTATEPGMSPRARIAPERLTTVTTEEPMTIESEQPAEARSTDGQGRVSEQPGDRELTSVDARASQAESAHVAVDQAHGSTIGTPAEKAPVRESVTTSAERPVNGRVPTAPQVEPQNTYTSARVGRDEPARNGSPRSMGVPAAEPGMAPRAQERAAAAPQEREAARPEGRTMVLPDMRGTADRDENPRVAPKRLMVSATEEPMAMESKQPAEARFTDEQGRVSQQPGDRKWASVDARASQAEGAHVAVDRTNGSTVGQGGRATGGTLADEAPVRESVTVSAERPVDGRVRAAPQVEPRNVYTRVWVGRDGPTRNGSPGSVDAPVTKPGMAPQVQERTVAAMQERETARPEGRSMALPDMRGTADRDENPRVAPERLMVSATEEPMAMGSKQPAEAQSTDGQGRVSQQPGDRTLGGPPADTAPVRESVTASAEPPVDGRVSTAAHVEPRNVHTPAKVGRDEPTLNGSPGSVDAPVTKPGMAPQVQERAVAAMQERETARPEGRTMVLPDMQGTADLDGSPRAAPERLTMTAIEEPMATESEQPTDAGSADAQGRVSEQPGDRTLGGPPADTAPVCESVMASAERPVDGRVSTAAHVEPKNVHTPAKVGRDEPTLNGSPGSVDAPVTKPGMAPQVQERAVAAMQERETGRPEGRSMALPHMRGTADRDENPRVAPERLMVSATEEPMAMESKQPAEAQSTDGQGRVSQQPGDRASGGTPADTAPVRESVMASAERPVDGRVSTAAHVEPKNTHTSTRVGRDESARDSTPRSTGVPATEPGMAREIVAVTPGKAAKAEIAEPRQAALRSAAHRKGDAMTASRAVTISRHWPEALVRSAVAESLARHRNLPNPLWDDGLQKAGRRESESDARPELAVVVSSTRTPAPAQGSDMSQTPEPARPVLTEPAGSSVTRQIAAHVSARAAQGGGEFRARLVPEHLGSVQIRVRVVRGVCTADIRADDAEVARYIESHSSDLKVSLAEHGIDLSGLSVSSRSRAQEGWGAATLSHSESDWSAPSWNGANARQQYAAAAFAGGSSGHGRGERRGMPAQSSPVVGTSHHAARQSGSPSPDEPIATRWVRGYARIDYLA